MAFQITPEWLIDLPEEMEHRIEEDKLIFWKTGVTVAIAAFSLPEGVSKLELLTQIQQKMPDQTLETFVSTKGEVVGLGFTEVLKASDTSDRLSLVTFTASDTPACKPVSSWTTRMTWNGLNPFGKGSSSFRR